MGIFRGAAGLSALAIAGCGAWYVVEVETPGRHSVEFGPAIPVLVAVVLLAAIWLAALLAWVARTVRRTEREVKENAGSDRPRP